MKKNYMGKKIDLRKEIVKALYGEKLTPKCPKCDSYNHIKIRIQHYGGNDWCQECGRIFDGGGKK